MKKTLLTLAVAALLGGNAQAQVSLPYVANMSDADEMAQWTVVNANGDVAGTGAERTWRHNGSEWVDDWFAQSNDDYLFTPAFNAPKGTLKLTYTAKGYSGRYSNAYEVLLTNSTDVETTGNNLCEVLESVDQNGLTALYVEHSMEFETPSAGVYYIAYHDISTDPWAVYIGSTQIEVIDAATGISDILTAQDVLAVTYYNVAGMKSDKPFSGVNVVVMQMSDGSTRTTKVVK